MAALAFLALSIESASTAFTASQTSARPGSADVVGNTTGFDSPSASGISASVVGGYSAQTGVTVINKGTVATTFTWTTTSDPSGVVTTVTQCAAGTAVGASCAIRFTGPSGKLAGVYTFQGRVDGNGAGFRSTLAPSIVTVTYSIP